jgi:NAD(P)H-dependent FMN reductase
MISASPSESWPLSLRPAFDPMRKSATYPKRNKEWKMANDRLLSIPVILGTTRKGRWSAPAARFMVQQMEKRQGVSTELIDLSELPMPIDDAGEQIKDEAFSNKMALADALVVVTPEYNHSFPGLLKHILDSCLKEYIHKAVGIVGVSAGPFGGVRAIQDFLPVMRELGLVNIFWDVNFGNVASVFDASGQLLDQAFVKRADKFLDELFWMAKTLRYGRENIAL